MREQRRGGGAIVPKVMVESRQGTKGPRGTKEKKQVVGLRGARVPKSVKGGLEKKKRTERVRRSDRGREKRVPNGKGDVKVRVVSPRRRGKKWGDRVATTKPCTKGANRQLRKKGRKVVGAPNKKAK
jgi:hypothetical protein